MYFCKLASEVNLNRLADEFPALQCTLITLDDMSSNLNFIKF